MHQVMTPLLLVTMMVGVATGLDWNADLTWFDQHRIEQIVLLCIVALGVVSVWRNAAGVSLASLRFWVRWALAGAFGLGLISAITATYPRFALLEWATLLLLLTLFLLLATQARQSSHAFDRWASHLIVALALIVALKIMVAYLAAMIEVGQLDTLLLFEGTFSNRRFFGQVASICIPLLAYPLLRGGMSGFARAALFLLLAVWWMLVIVSGTRGTWVALAMASLVLAVCAWSACKSWLKVQLWALALGALLFAILFVWLPVWIGLDAALENRLSNLATMNGREVLWSLAWSQIQAHPWLGIGPMHMAAIRNDFGAHPHNAVLQLAAEWGVPAALLLILPVAAGMVHLLTRLRQHTPHSVLLVCLTGSVLAAAAQSMVDGVIVIPYTQTLLVMSAGWALGVYWREPGVICPVTVTPTLRFGISILMLSGVVMLLYGIFPEVLNRAEVTQAYVDAGNVLIPPRYWGVGWIP